MPFALVMLAAGLVAAPGADARDVEALLQKYDCAICHARDETRTGPSYVEIAVRYRGNPKAAAILTRVVAKGAHGSGPWPMPPLPQVPRTDARLMAEYILSLRK